MTKKPKKITRIKDLPPNKGLGGVRFRYPADSRLYYWHSQWQKGVWGKEHLDDTQVHPLFCDDLKEALEWELA